MNAEHQPDQSIRDWLRQDLDAINEPGEAVQGALAAASTMPQHHGWRYRLQRLVGATSVTSGSADRPEVVLQPESSASVSGPGDRAMVLRRERQLPRLAILAVAAFGLGAALWLVLLPGWPVGSLMGAPAATMSLEQPRRELPPVDPNGRDIRVGSSDIAHFSTISGALAATVDGDRIRLEPGTYRDELLVDKKVTISGSGARDSVVVEPRPLPDGTSEDDLARDVFHLVESDAILEGFTVRGPRHGNSIWIEGGAPIIRDMDILPETTQESGSPTKPRHGLLIEGASSALVQDSFSSAFVSIAGGSSPHLEGLEIVGSCIHIEGEGTAPFIDDVRIEGSRCPLFTISVAGGANPTMDVVNIVNTGATTGIRIVGAGTTSEIRGSTISGGPVGISIGTGSDVVVIATQVEGAETGILVKDATAELTRTRLVRNGIGLVAEGEAILETQDNEICENTQNLDLAAGVQLSTEHNAICMSSAAASN